ncbi:MAG: YceI family protein [Sphingobacteriales bacterium]|nr:YceI family protein [Sphingobacteriales bacterium]
MKKILLLICLIAVGVVAFKPAAEVYSVDVNKSKIEWIGKKLTGQHTGEIKLASGVLNYDGETLTGGSFIINMNSITNKDLSKSSAANLLGQLKSEDFFSVDKYPTAKFVITSVKNMNAENATITGDLTIKGITKPISFTTAIKKRGNIVVAIANGVKVDRAKYNVRYGSKSFFADIGDKAISDEFELNITLLARK